MGKKLGLILGGILLFSQVTMAQATNFSVSATVPLASSITMTVSKVTVNASGTVTGWSTQPAGTIALPFGTLTLNTATNTYLDGPSSATFYWAIDLTPSGGTGVAQPTVSYTETTTLPTGQTAGLGSRAGIQFSKVVYVTSSTSTETPISGQHYALTSLGASGITVPYTGAVGGWMRMDIGLCTGNTNSANGTTDPANCGPFTPADLPATYQGTLGVTAVLD